MTTTPIDELAIARGVLRSVEGDTIVLALPHTDYELRLGLTVSPRAITTPVGKRVHGVIEAEALRIHASPGGGRFIEPAAGEPRIVSGMVKALDIDGDVRRVLVDLAVPMWLHLRDDQDLDLLVIGTLVNCYIRGARFTPA